MSSRSSSNSFKPPVFPELHCVGWIKSAHGIRGELFLRLNSETADWADEADELALLPRGASEPLRFELEKMSAHKDGWIVRLKGVADRNRAEELAKSSVYIPTTLLESEPGEAIYLRQIEGFAVLDKSIGHVGEVVGFSSNGPQDLLRVSREGQEVLIPLVDEFLVAIDFDKKTLSMDLPPGLVDLEEE